MIEFGTAVTVCGFAALFHFSERRVTNLALIQWVICGIRQRRTLLESSGRNEEAERLTELSEFLSQGCGSIFHKIALPVDAKKRIEKAVMSATADDFLNRIGVTEGAFNHLPSKNALYWLGGKTRTR